MWRALKAVAATLEDMACGRARASVYISSLDPGVGKTTCVVEFIRALLRSPEHHHVGVLLCVQRKEQIRSIIKEADLAEADYAVFTSDEALNSVGCGDPYSAKVLFTTHAMIESRCQNRKFSTTSEFHYKDRVREVRIWDEAILPGQDLTLHRDIIAALLAPFRTYSPGFADEIEELFNDLKTAKDKAILLLPDLAKEHRIDLNEALRVVRKKPEMQQAVEALWFLFGKHVTVRQDGAYGATLLDYKDTLPDDIKPLLALDASGRVRSLYRLWEDCRGGLFRLPSAQKRYDNLTIHVWETGGGKRAFRDNGTTLVEGIVSTIETRLDEPWLIVHHKETGTIDVENAVRGRLSFWTDVHFVHWGAHDATNAFAHIPNVILAGTLFYRPSVYEARGRLAAAHPSSEGAFDEASIPQVMAGEHRHLILQALCRGAVRKCIGDGCPETRAFVIASTRSGIRKELPSIFPGATIGSWTPVRKPLRGKVRAAVEFIDVVLKDDPDAFVEFRSVTLAIGWTDTKEFKHSIRRHPDFQQALVDLGIEEWGPGRHPKGFRRVKVTTDRLDLEVCRAAI